jgi:hypothetical protein
MSCEESGGRVVSEELLHLLYPEDETTRPDEDEEANSSTFCGQVTDNHDLDVMKITCSVLYGSAIAQSLFF